MSIENRKAARRIIRHPAVILNPDGSVFLPCTVMDVSATGAKLVLQAPAKLPDEFIVLLAKHAKVHRKCQISWQEGAAIGVRFVIEHPKKSDGIS
jgi:hypothetical protein